MSSSADRGTEQATPVASLALERIVRSPAALVENLPIGICTCDRDGNLVQYNRRAVELWGRTPEPRERFCGAFRIFAADGAEILFDRSPMAEVLDTGIPVRDRELGIERPNGERRTILANVDPLLDDHGNLVGGVNCFQDITETRRVQRTLDEERHVGRRVFEALPVAIYATDAQGKLVSFNKAAQDLWGYAPRLGEQMWCGAQKLYTLDGKPLPHEECPMAHAIRERRPQIGPEAVAERPDGTRISFLPHPTPIFDSKGELVGAVNMLLDLTDRKRADSQQRGLIDELNHRVKNTLATIQSLAAQTMRGSKYLSDNEFEGRLLALSRVHDQLSRHAWEWADFAIIANETFTPLRGSTNSNVRLHGPSLRLNSKIALAVGMVLHELASNAVRHGALSKPAGAVELDWHTDGKTLYVDWQEFGGPHVVTPRSRGFGLRFMERSIAHELGGESVVEFLPDGVHCTMAIPLPE